MTTHVQRLAGYGFLTLVLGCLGVSPVRSSSLLAISAGSDSILRYNAFSGTFEGTFIASGSGGLCDARDMTWGPDGDLYVLSWGTTCGTAADRVIRYDGNTGALVSVLIGPANLDNPTSLAFGPDGNLWISSGAKGLVRRYSPSTGALLNTAIDLRSQSQFAFILDFEFGPSGQIYVADSSGDLIFRCDGRTGAVLGSFPAGGNITSAFDIITFALDGALLVSTSDVGVIRHDPVTGAILGTLIPSGSGGLNTPGAVAFAPDGNLWVASLGTDQILRYSPTTGSFIDAIVPTGSGGLSLPTELLFQCATSATTLCVSGSRFRVETSWQLNDGTAGLGQAVQLTADTGYFWFFGRDNVEVVVKVLNACTPPFNRFWVFASGLTNVKVTTRVTDSASGEVKIYQNAAGHAFQPIQDTTAFATCP